MTNPSQCTPLGLWLSEQCREHQEQQQALARVLRVSPGFLSAVIHGRKQWPARMVTQLLQRYPVSAQTGRWVRAASLVSGPELRLSLSGLSLAEREQLLADLLVLSVPIERLVQEESHD